MKRKLLLFIFILYLVKISEAKVIDRYGFRIGAVFEQYYYAQRSVWVI